MLVSLYCFMFSVLMKDVLYKNISKYAQLTENEFEIFAESFELREYKKKDLILKEGDYCLFEGFVLDGCFKIFFLNENGLEQTLYFAVKDWWITDLDSFINNVPSTLSIEALEDSKVLLISKKQKLDLYEKLPVVERLFRIMNQQASIALQRRILSLMTKTADKRYIEFLQKYPGLEQRLTQQQIASYLGISHEFLSKIRKKTVLGK